MKDDFDSFLKYSKFLPQQPHATYLKLLSGRFVCDIACCENSFFAILCGDLVSSSLGDSLYYESKQLSDIKRIRANTKPFEELPDEDKLLMVRFYRNK